MNNIYRKGLGIALCMASAGLLFAHGNAVAQRPTYGYTLAGVQYNTLEEVEAVIRQTQGGDNGYALLELAFPIPNNLFLAPGNASSLDYRPLGALSSNSQVLTLGASSVVSSYRPHVAGWPPATIPATCQTAACPAGVCTSFADEKALVQCTFDNTWHTRANFSWNRQGAAQGVDQITGAPQSVTGSGQASGVLNFLPPSSTSSGWGSTITITAAPAAGTSLSASEGQLTGQPESPAVNSQFPWNIQRRDAITCPAGTHVSGSATSAGDACNSPLQKEIVPAPPVTQSPNQCGVGDPCYPSNGNNRASEDVFQYGALNFRIHYNSLRQTRPYSYIDRNWSHSYAKRILTEWSSPGHLTGAETQGVSVAQVFVQDERSDLEVFIPTSPLGTLRSTSSLGKLLIYMPRAGSAPPFWQLNQGDGVIEIYDRAGRFIQRIDADEPSRNLTISYFGGQINIDASYSGNGPHQQEDFWRIDRVTDGNGRYASFQYSSDNYLWLTRIVADDALTVLAEFHYDSDHRMERLTFADHSERTFLYNEPSNIFVGGTIPAGIRGYWLTGILDEDNRRFGTFRYDNWGRVVDNWHGPDSEKVHIDYTGDTASTVTFPSGVATTFNYAAGEPYRHPSQSSNSAGSRHYDYYPTTHRLKTITDANNNVSVREYDPLGLYVTAKVEAKNTPEQRRTEFDWDSIINRITHNRVYKQPNNGTPILTSSVTYSYSANGVLTGLTETDEQTAASRTTANTYCTSTNAGTGCLIGRLRTVNGPRTDVNDITTLRYYTSTDISGCATTNGGECHQLGDLKSVTNALGQVATYVKYDRAGRLRRVRDANGVLTDLNYSPRGWLTDQISRANSNGAVSPLDSTTHFAHDGSGNVTRITLPDLTAPAYSLAYDYDSAHRLTGVTDTYGNKVVYSLDPSGNRTAEAFKDSQNQLKHSLQRVYDQLGHLQQLLNAQGATVVSYETPPDTPPPGVSYEGGYDGNGNPVYSVDGLGTDTFRSFDPLNRIKAIMQDHSGPTSVTQNATTNLAYDERDNLTAVTDPDNVATSYVYDGLNNLRSVNSQDSGLTVYTPDSAGNRVFQTDARGVVSTYSYDALNRLTAITFVNASENVAYRYDQPDSETGCSEAFSLGRLTTMTDESGSTTYCYDRRGNIVRKQQLGIQSLQTVSYAYDKADRLASITYPSGAIVSYVRDNVGRITSITRKADAFAPSETIISIATYLPFGPLNTLTFGNARTLTKDYDADYAIDRVFSSNPNGLVLDFTTDVMGNIKDAKETLLPASPKRSYFYDRLYRLQHVDKGLNNSVEIYGYNATGDRILKKLGIAPSQPYDYTTGTHRLAAVDGVSRDYDQAGNTTSRGDGATLGYNSRNRLNVITHPASGASKSANGKPPKNLTLYYYNGRGERVGAGSSLTYATTGFVYDEGGHLLGSYAGGSVNNGETTPTEVIYLGDMPVAITIDGVLSYLETDHLGTPRIAANPVSNAQQWKWDFFADAFGDNEPTIAASGGIDVSLRFPGQYAEGNGLNYNYFRDYETGTGRYLESDPIGLNGGLNRYAYVHGNPSRLSDPKGNEAVDFMRQHPGPEELNWGENDCQKQAELNFTLNLIPFVGTAYGLYQLADEQGNPSDVAGSLGSTAEGVSSLTERGVAANTSRAEELRRAGRNNKQQKVLRKLARADGGIVKFLKPVGHAFGAAGLILNVYEYKNAYQACPCDAP